MNEVQRKATARHLRRAAKQLEDGLVGGKPIPSGMCGAIYWTCNRSNPPARAGDFIRHMYYPSCQRSNHSWWYAPPGEEMEARIVALCFAADVLESGEELWTRHRDSYPKPWGDCDE